MDFDSLPRRDLQFFCKRNKIPANMTNIAMADALKSLEIVEGIDEFVNRSDQSPISVAKNLPSAARTTRRRTAKDETELVTRSCQVTRKSLAEEMDQENRDANTNQDPLVPQNRRRAAVSSVAVKFDVNVSKTPAPRSTRKAPVGASSKKDETVQRVYSTRRAVKLLEESMADLSLKTKESLNQDSPKDSKSQEESEEAEVISVRDLNDLMEKEWDGLKNDPDLDVLYGDLGDITFSDANTKQETSQEDDFVVVDNVAVTCNEESESEQIKKGSESDSEETEHGSDLSEDDDDDVVNRNQEAFGNVSKIESVPTAVEMEEHEGDKDSKESETEEEEEICESDEWSDFEIEDVVVENSFESEELIDSKTEEAPVSDKKSPALSSSTLAESISDQNKSGLKLVFAADNEGKNKEDVVEMVLNNNGEGKSEAMDSKKEKKKKKKKTTIDEESLKDASVRQLTKMVREFTIKNKQQHKSLE